ncbi:leucine-rich repeat domain-containing protein [Mariniphaga sp.]|uniref:leucine-rich repeat domain-containing protein n=1 Tax=Mariniphaga sp. TaxID=1954475 RepID=UPI00356469AE
MNLKELKNKLLAAYSAENLNRISVILINFYKNQQFSSLQTIAEILSEFVWIEVDENGKGFAKFMMLYHPDRGEFHRSEISRLADTGNFDQLLEYSHILKLERIEEIESALDSIGDIDYSPVYDWDFDSEGFTVVNEKRNTSDTEQETFRKNKKLTLYDAIKIRYYGQTKKEFPTWYLEDLDELELSASDIGNLDGIQYCVHTKNLDLSDNYIVDLTPMENLRVVEELNLANNRIEIIDALGNLINLKILDLSDNKITDIEPILELPLLEYVNLSGNKISSDQINRLEELDIDVDI